MEIIFIDVFIVYNLRLSNFLELIYLCSQISHRLVGFGPKGLLLYTLHYSRANFMHFMFFYFPIFEAATFTHCEKEEKKTSCNENYA